MKLLFDQNLSFKSCRLLADLFPGSNHVRPLGLDRVDDRALWIYARDNGYTVVTQDSDFADLALALGSPPKVVWLRCGNTPTARIEALMRASSNAIAALESSNDVDCLELY